MPSGLSAAPVVLRVAVRPSVEPPYEFDECGFLNFSPRFDSCDYPGVTAELVDAIVRGAGFNYEIVGLDVKSADAAETGSLRPWYANIAYWRRLVGRRSGACHTTYPAAAKVPSVGVLHSTNGLGRS